MPRYRAVVSKTAVSREVVEIEASSLLQATIRVQNYVDGTYRARRAITIVASHDEDNNATENLALVSVKEA